MAVPCLLTFLMTVRVLLWWLWQGFHQRLIKLMLHADADNPSSAAYKQVQPLCCCTPCYF